MLWTRRQDGAVLPSDGAAGGTTLQRRGALAGFAVVLAGLMAKVSELPARAADGQPLLLGRGNQADSPTQLDKTSTVNDGAALVVTNGSGPGIQGSGVGDNPVNAGVTGFGEGVLSYGVHGVGGAIGVFGETNSPSGDTGVLGSGRNSGVTGRSTDGTGVVGSGSNGVVGVANRSGGNGVVGQGGVAGAGVFGQAPVQGATAETYGVFSAGRFGATGPITALIQGTDGVQRVVFDTAGPDSLIVDVGSATLDPHGRATVPLAPDFAALIDTSNYQVFVTPYAESEGLFVGRRTPTSFDVASHHGGREANIAFGFQVVGKRKDVTVSRPSAAAAAQPTPPRRPEVPNPPPPAEPPRRRDR